MNIWTALMLLWLVFTGGNAPAEEPPVELYFFWSEQCPHCRAAHPFVSAIPVERPWVRLHTLEISRHPEHAGRFAEMAAAIGQRAEAVPAFIFCGVLEVGWQDAASSGAALLARLDACRRHGVLPPASEQTRVTLPGLGEVDGTQLSLPLFTLMIAGLDAFNPCAFFVLLFLLSLLAQQRDRRRLLAVAGVFVVTSGVVYFVFMAMWLNLFRLLGALSWITVAAGGLAVGVGLINLKDFFVPRRGPSLSIPESARPGLFRRMRAVLQSGNTLAMLSATLLLAVAANSYELLCTAGFPMIYTRILTLSDLSPAAHYAYLILYNLIYVLPLLCIVLIFVARLSSHKLSVREGRLLKLMSGCMMLELGGVMLAAPGWLSDPVVTALLLVVALVVTAGAARWTREAPKPMV